MVLMPAFDLRPCQSTPEFMRVVEEILLPSFPPEELSTREEFELGFSAGVFLTMAAFDDAGTPLAAAIGMAPSEPGDVILLTWLAVGERGRGQGIGGALLDTTLADWQARYQPYLVLGEVEDPDFHEGSAATGDPRARLRFYHRHGVRHIDVPFVMPLVAADAARVDHMMLLAFAGRALSEPDSPRVGQAVERFLRAYLQSSAEPCDADGRYCPAIEQMLAAAPAARILPPESR